MKRFEFQMRPPARHRGQVRDEWRFHGLLRAEIDLHASLVAFYSEQMPENSRRCWRTRLLSAENFPLNLLEDGRVTCRAFVHRTITRSIATAPMGWQKPTPNPPRAHSIMKRHHFCCRDSQRTTFTN